MTSSWFLFLCPFEFSPAGLPSMFPPDPMPTGRGAFPWCLSRAPPLPRLARDREGCLSWVLLEQPPWRPASIWLLVFLAEEALLLPAQPIRRCQLDFIEAAFPGKETTTLRGRGGIFPLQGCVKRGELLAGFLLLSALRRGGGTQIPAGGGDSPPLISLFAPGMKVISAPGSDILLSQPLTSIFPQSGDAACGTQIRSHRPFRRACALYQHEEHLGRRTQVGPPPQIGDSRPRDSLQKEADQQPGSGASPCLALPPRRGMSVCRPPSQSLALAVTEAASLVLAGRKRRGKHVQSAAAFWKAPVSFRRVLFAGAPGGAARKAPSSARAPIGGLSNGGRARAAFCEAGGEGARSRGGGGPASRPPGPGRGQAGWSLSSGGREGVARACGGGGGGRD